jgi:micrococcal nuclease
LWCLAGHKIFSCRVIGIKDGDTVEILTADRKTIIVRLNGIDAPEKDQPYSQKSKESLSKLVFRKQVKLCSFGNDRYGRLLADIYVDSINVNYIQVAEGLAWHYKKYSDDVNLAQLEQQARAQKLGLWQEKDPTPPWEFRKNK